MSFTRVKGTLVLAPENPDEEKEAIHIAAHILQRGGLVAFPTETVYGLGADALNEQAVERIFRAKKRPADNPLIVHVAGLPGVAELVTASFPAVKLLAEHFWPGPLTLVLPKRDIVPAVTTAGLTSVAVRVPAHPLALGLLQKSKVPVAAPSANLSGRPSPTTAQHVLDDLAGEIDALLDGGYCSIGVESTVLSLLSNPPLLLRPGGVTQESLEDVLKEKVLDLSLSGEEKGLMHGVPLSPGLKYRHYATKAPLYLVEGDGELQQQKINALVESFLVQGRHVGLLLFTSSCAHSSLPPSVHLELLGSKSEPAEAARQLFSALRRLDKGKVEVIVAEGLEERGVGQAVMNRLRKGAVEIISAD